ncbi:hypothetical protein AB0A63_24505 [Lentzea sp. NPDC042327]|uniref:hypothetical protein n=1 Tax=Lentzea sp. NPDC042327 TaxID=3154801 RepID=UPI0033DC27B3
MATKKNDEKDPTSWPALVHRLTRSWSALLRFLVTLAVIALLAGATWWALDLGSIELGPVVVHGTPLPAA